MGIISNLLLQVLLSIAKLYTSKCTTEHHSKKRHSYDYDCSFLIVQLSESTEKVNM